MRLKYETWAPSVGATVDINRANAICAEFAEQGYDLTLRQLYYQFVARDFIANNMASYTRLGNIINKARLAGMLDWEYIVDRTRNLSGANHFDKPQDAVLKAARSFSQDLWRNQPVRIEVWVEKEALSQVVSRASSQHDVDHFSCRGYVSQSELWSAGQRLLAYILAGQRVVVLHLGDHDPSGIDMTRDIDARLRMFLTRDYHRANMEELGSSTTKGAIWTHMNRRASGTALEVRRIALNMDQVEQYNPPPNPAKVTDSRFAAYRTLYGEESWELDALTPQVLDELIQRNIVVERDDEVWAETVAEEERNRAMMVAVAERWPELKGLLERA